MISRSGQATTAWETGTQNPSKSPTGEMKRAGKKYDLAMQAAIRDQAWQKAVADLKDEDIFTMAAKVGGAAWAAGISARADKIQRAYALLMPKLAAHLAKIDAMPTDTPEQREAKMLANLRGMRELGTR
jgi:hypothetical protein